MVRSYWISEDFNSHGFRFYQRYGPIAYSFHLRSGAGGLWLNLARPNEPVPAEELERIRDNFSSIGGREVLRFPPVYPRLRVAAVAFSSFDGRPTPKPEPPQPLAWHVLSG